MNTLSVTPVSATFELENNDVYFSKEKYDVLLNGTIALHDVDRNVFTLFDLKPNTDYVIQVRGEKITIHTPNVTETIFVAPGDDLQKCLDQAKKGALVVVEPGVHNIVSLVLHSDLTLYVKKGASIQASINESDYPRIPPYHVDEKGNKEVYGNWEGAASDMTRSIFHAHHCKNLNIVGEGTLDGRAQESTWWVDVKNHFPRPHLVYFCYCENVSVVGMHLKNSPQWTIHPFFCKDCGFYDIDIENPKVSPNTDGVNPQACKHTEIVGVHFSVGDDCIAIKSGKIDIGKTYKQPCDQVLIRNCWMQYGHGGVVLGSEMAGGITNLTVERCLFDSTDRGLRIKSRRGRGKLAVIDGVTFRDIEMKNVLTPLVMNMFYNCDPDGESEYVYTKKKLPVDDRTPYLGEFTFERIHATGVEYAAGYFYGLPEMPIGGIKILDSSFSYKEKCGSDMPAMMTDAEYCSQRGFIFRNVKKVEMKNVICTGYKGERVETQNVDQLEDR